MGIFSTKAKQPYRDTLPFWPESVALTTILLILSTCIGLCIGRTAIIPAKIFPVFIACLIFTGGIFAAFRAFRLSNYVTFFIACAFFGGLFLLIGHMYAYQISKEMYHAFAKAQKVSPPPYTVWKYFWFSFAGSDGVPTVRPYGDWLVWLLHATFVAVTTWVAPLLVCVMFADGDCNRKRRGVALPAAVPPTVSTDRTESDC